MKSLLTVSGVVFAHICVFLLFVNGCRGPSSDPNQWNSDTSIYSGGIRDAQSAPVAAHPDLESSIPESVVKPVAATPEKPVSAKPTQIESDPATGTQDVYRVKKGEYLSTIALRHGLTAKELADANGISLTSVLKIGQTLKIPAPKQKSATKNTEVSGDIYVVQKGDVLGTIAQKNKTTIAKIKEANNLKNDVIRVGQKLIIPSKHAKKPADAEPVSANVEKKSDSELPRVGTSKSSEPSKSSSDLDFGMPEGGFGSLDNVPKEMESQPEESDGPATGTTEE